MSIASARRHKSQSFLDRLADGFLGALSHALEAEDLARGPGLLQSLDPRLKTAAAFALILAAVSLRSLVALYALFLVALALGWMSRIPPARFFLRVWLGVLVFTGALALPALFLVPGDTMIALPGLDLTVTSQGLRSALFLLGRAETSASLAALLVLTTPWPHILRALRIFRMPTVLVAILGMTHRYIFVLLQSAAQMAEARRSRLMGRLPPAERRRLVTASAGVLLDKALHLSGEVHLAMIARGFRGEIYLLDPFRMRRRDWVAALAVALIVLTALWIGR